MAYIACDQFHGCVLFENKPIRKIFPEEHRWRKENNILGIWTDPLNGAFIHISDKLIKLLFDNNMLYNCHIPLDKRNMNWGDNPICVSLY